MGDKKCLVLPEDLLFESLKLEECARNRDFGCPFIEGNLI
jgi:hypothetical protein